MFGIYFNLFYFLIGPYTWRGTVFAVSVEDDYLFRDKTHYYIPVIRGESPVDKYAYLGKKYQLTTRSMSCKKLGKNPTSHETFN